MTDWDAQKDKIEALVQFVKDRIATIQEHGSVTLIDILAIGGELITEVEGVFSGYSGAEKKQVALHVMTSTYDAIDPDIPYLPEPLESLVERWFIKGKLMEWLSNVMIDVLVQIFNRFGWPGMDADGGVPGPSNG